MHLEEGAALVDEDGPRELEALVRADGAPRRHAVRLRPGLDLDAHVATLRRRPLADREGHEPHVDRHEAVRRALGGPHGMPGPDGPASGLRPADRRRPRKRIDTHARARSIRLSAGCEAAPRSGRVARGSLNAAGEGPAAAWRRRRSGVQ